MKVIHWLQEHILFVVTLFLLAFIPLYPKIPLLDIQHTWVYIRVEDFVIAAVLGIFFVQLIRKKATIKSPLTMPILFFWIVGALSTLFAILVIFPTLVNVFPNLALLHYLRRIEYLSLFFVAFAAMKDKKMLHYIVAVLTITLLAVIFYGFGQRYLGFPAFLTMNEEFAKGIPLKISEMARVPSTFAGHYDLAAYLVMLIPIMGSLIFGYKKWSLKIIFFVSALLALVLLLMTASRISFGVYLLTIAFMLVLQQKKRFIIPVIILSIVILNLFQGISARFGSTISEAEVIYDARTGQAIGIATRGANNELIIEEKESTGENLPQGSGYIGIPGGSTTRDPKYNVVKKVLKKTGDRAGEITNIEGDFVVRKSLAYDISFTTRFQGTWPRALNAFKRNILLGSGYSSINLASDGNYLRILGEVGLLGLFSFMLIFICLGILAKKVLPDIDSPTAKSFVIGVLAGVFGVALNAVMIDVFEASKVAFAMWTLIGLTTGLLVLYQKKQFNMFKEVQKLVTSPIAMLVYLLAGTIGVYSLMVNNFFVGDDFTWLRWIADCKKIVTDGFMTCESQQNIIANYFTNSEGFFYRPGTKLYFHFMYAIAWFSPFLYHVASILLHFLATAFVFLISLRLLRSKFYAAITAVLFMVVSGHYEAIYWISSTGHLITAVLILCSTYFFILFRDTKNKLFLLPAVLASASAPLFHEAGVIAPFFVLAYDLIMERKELTKQIKHAWYYLLFLLPLPIYFILKQTSQSFWATGDYSYNLLNLLPNIIGNILGNILVTLIGTRALPVMQNLREFVRANELLAFLAIGVTVAMLYFGFKYLHRKVKSEDRQSIYVAGIWFVIAALPFLGLGTITSRYTYLPSFGILLLIVFLIKKALDSTKIHQLFTKSLLLLLLSGLVFFHVSELQRINKDWEYAGKITNNLLINIGGNFASTKTKILPPNPTFLFANVPIRYGEAWVFPVGLPDALWFTFQNQNVTVKTFRSLDEALPVADITSSPLIFNFEKDGNISQVFHSKTP